MSIIDTVRAALPPLPRLRTGEIGTQAPDIIPSAGGAGTHELGESDYNPELAGLLIYNELDRMRRSDPQVRAALRVIKLPIMSVEWRVDPAPEAGTEAERMAEWVEDVLMNRMTHTWDWLLRQMLLHLDFGVMPMEIVWSVEDDPEYNRPMAILQDLSPRMPKTITHWHVERNGMLASVTQLDSDGDQLVIPADKLVVFTNEQEGADYKGVSILRSARKDWLLKERAQRSNAIAIEKRTAGVDVGTLTGVSNQNDPAVQAGEETLMTVRNHERAYVQETDKWKYRVEGITGTVLDPLPTIEYHDLMIARSVLAEFLAMGGNSTGSLAMHSDKTQFFLMALRGVSKYVTETLNRSVIQQMIRYNFPNIEPAEMPKLRHGRLDRRMFQSIAETLKQLVDADLLTPSADIEEEIRSELELPELPEEEEEQDDPDADPGPDPENSPEQPEEGDDDDLPPQT